MSGISKVIRSVLAKVSGTSKFKKIWTPTAEGANGSSAYTDRNIRFDRYETRRFLQINAQTEEPALKRFIQKNGTHKVLAEIDVASQTGTEAQIETFVSDAIKQASKFD